MPSAIPAILSGRPGVTTSKDKITTFGPYSLDDVIERETLNEIYARWLYEQEPSYDQRQSMSIPRVPLSEWCTDIFELPKYRLYATCTTYGWMSRGEGLLEFGMKNHTDSSQKLYTISLANIRKDTFTACYSISLSSADYTNVVRRDFPTSSEAELASYLTISFRLPSWQELYGTNANCDDEEDIYDDVSIVESDSGPSVHTDVSDSGDNMPNDDNGVTSRTTTTALPDNTVRRHTRFEEREAPEIEDHVTRKLRNDLKHWSVLEVRPNTMLIYPQSEFSVFRGRYKTFPDTIATGTLYHRPLHFSDQYGGYWINRNSELAKLIDKTSQDMNSQRFFPESSMNKDSKMLQEDSSDWQVLEETEHMLLVRNNNPNSRLFGRGVSRSARRQSLAYSQRDGGFWINKNSPLAKLIRDAKPKTQADTITFADDVTKNWNVVMTKQNFDNDGCVESALIRPCKKSRYENRPSVIDTEGAYHRPIYYHSGDDGYWVSGDSYLYQCVSENGGLLRQ